ncbi:unnamed protein product [Penicillium salamii]|uniref:Pheromone n=1 Tax=Penicillium salamii TaxID=1612424 RepID=A0A9W4NV41_9EURO|nr:unnamed protein product [Penicillium salamii]CAG8031111.1 unnamed protein product [Penicillium salamii]CAG8066132.1 unnamed protein product [Penicillium salamii]CAG8268403.1 unnamed protein product [Penicillium salamii]CAG8312067.1 unnamed protein product [Penicillium salamii]
MKLTTIAIAVLGATVVQAEPVNRQTTPRPYGSIPKWCAHPGQGCYMMKRSADSSWEVKRSAEALAEAMAKDFPTEIPKWCAHPGQGCAKAKRAALAAEEVQRTADELAEAMDALDSHVDE